MTWLNPARWLLVLAAIAAAGLGLWRLEAHIEQRGYDRAQAQYADAVRKASEAARVKEAALNTTNRKLQDDLNAEKTRHAVAVGALDDAERVFMSTIGAASAAGTATTATGRIDAGPGPERVLLGQCAQALGSVAKAADGLEVQVVGLQRYITQICQAP